MVTFFGTLYLRLRWWPADTCGHVVSGIFSEITTDSSFRKTAQLYNSWEAVQKFLSFFLGAGRRTDGQTVINWRKKAEKNLINSNLHRRERAGTLRAWVNSPYIYIYIYTFVISLFIIHLMTLLPMPVAKRSKAWVCCRSIVGIVGSNSAGAWMSFSCDFCVLTGRDICDGLITCPEKSYRM